MIDLIREPMHENQWQQLSKKVAEFTEFLVVLTTALPFWSDTKAEMIWQPGSQ